MHQPESLTASAVTLLHGGVANSTWLVELADGGQVAVKGGHGTPPGLFRAEAEGLAALRDIGGLRTPEVIGVSDTSLTLQALNPRPPGDNRFWEEARHTVAGLHSHTSARFGWHRDGWLGRLVQRNTWDTDGHRFFAEHRHRRRSPGRLQPSRHPGQVHSFGHAIATQ
ncbi:fructosamine kinase family protein [Kitasatospora sp. NPDC101155]|uniref:fructosamine kinase family protein n=1 Tax=Kitasatospora sp. NPDC101155 TaxID=3364097 RepID=UPI00381394D4